MSKPETPWNPVIPPSMAENKAIWHIELKSQLPNNGRREYLLGGGNLHSHQDTVLARSVSSYD